jgi:hypothetical protein
VILIQDQRLWAAIRKLDNYFIGIIKPRTRQGNIVTHIIKYKFLNVYSTISATKLDNEHVWTFNIKQNTFILRKCIRWEWYYSFRSCILILCVNKAKKGRFWVRTRLQKKIYSASDMMVGWHWEMTLGLQENAFELKWIYNYIVYFSLEIYLFF